MAWATEELIRQFRLAVPAMPADVVSDEELESDIDAYRDYVSEGAFGRMFPKALAYFIAHMRTVNDMLAALASEGGNAGDKSMTMDVTSEREGDLSRSYSNGSSSSSSSNSEAMLRKTVYGQQFLMLQSMAVIPAAVRIGGGRCDWR